MRKYFRLLNDEQISFIENELRISRKILFSMDDKDADAVYDEIGLIEADEIISAGDGSLSNRGKLATDIVTILGNALAEDMGWIDEN